MKPHILRFGGTANGIHPFLVHFHSEIWDLHLHASQLIKQGLHAVKPREKQGEGRGAGGVYLNELHQLCQDVRGEFEVENFGVNGSSPCFNQVVPNQIPCSYRQQLNFVSCWTFQKDIWNVWVLVQLVPQMTVPYVMQRCSYTKRMVQLVPTTSWSQFKHVFEGHDNCETAADQRFSDFFFIRRSYYQHLVSYQAHLMLPVLQPPVTVEWKIEENLPDLEVISFQPVRWSVRGVDHHWMQDSASWRQALTCTVAFCKCV